MTQPNGIRRLRLGSCPDSWGVWFADDPQQTPWERFLDELAAAGYEWLELGPYGYLPTDPSRLRDELDRRALKVAGGTVAGHSALYRIDAYDGILEGTRKVADLTAGLGAKHLVFVPVQAGRDHAQPADPGDGRRRRAGGALARAQALTADKLRGGNDVTLKVGVIGVGMIGQDHIRRLTKVLSAVDVVAVTDVDLDRAKAVADGVPGATVHGSGEELINDDDVDAVVVCSWGETHEAYLLASIKASKPVFCEKPLATTQEACRRVLAAETAVGRRLVQVGYMRRYDAAYRALRDVVHGGAIGNPLLMHCTHRNPSVPGYYTKESAITDTAVHEIDMVRWMFGEEIAATTVLVPRKSRNGGDLQDPLVLLLEMHSGVLVDVEISVNIRYGYDIRGEVVGEDGTAALGEASPVRIRREGLASDRVPTDWRERFIRAYDVELQEWVDAVSNDGQLGPSSWDGYAAAVVSDAALEALRTGTRTTVQLPTKPDLYVT